MLIFIAAMLIFWLVMLRAAYVLFETWEEDLDELREDKVKLSMKGMTRGTRK